jgi:hypothetical protein
MGAEVALGYTGTAIPPPGGSDGLQQGAIELPEYTAVIALAPGISCEALMGKLTSEVVGPVGRRVCSASNFDPSRKSTLPLGTPAPPGVAETMTRRVVD